MNWKWWAQFTEDLLASSPASFTSFLFTPLSVFSSNIDLSVSSPSSEESSELSFGWSNAVESVNSEEVTKDEQVDVDLDRKPAEEWTQEDYARYYGL